MKITEAEFVKSAIDPRAYPKDRRPEIAFVGRSNVGKSSLLNHLLNRRGLAKTSATPGKTQLLNFFSINRKYYFVDLPGYGYAKVPQAVKDRWGRVVTDYLYKRDTLRLVIVLVDSRHAASPLDIELLELLDRAQRPAVVVATKHDKLKSSARARQLKALRAGLGLDGDSIVIPYSTVTGHGRKELWEALDSALEPDPNNFE
jgi:GTP-binding protein